jgi:hypothetical protein
LPPFEKTRNGRREQKHRTSLSDHASKVATLPSKTSHSWFRPKAEPTSANVVASHTPSFLLCGHLPLAYNHEGVSSSNPKLPKKKKRFVRWQSVLAACGMGFGLYSVWLHIFSNHPKITEGHLIFSFSLDCVVIVMCGITIILSVIE